MRRASSSGLTTSNVPSRKLHCRWDRSYSPGQALLSNSTRCCWDTNARSSSTEVQPISVHFVSADLSVNAAPGDNIYELAQRSGIDTITVGCCTGNCGVCEVEVRKFANGSEDTVPIVVRSCITALPPGYPTIEISELIDDVWGLDGYDT